MRKEIKLGCSLEQFILRSRLNDLNCFSVLLQGRRMNTLNNLYNEIEATLQFPEYFGRNWNAFDECIQDLEWLNKKKFILAINEYEKILENFEFNIKYKDNEVLTFEDCLISAVDKWKGNLVIYINLNNKIFQLIP